MPRAKRSGTDAGLDDQNKPATSKKKRAAAAQPVTQKRRDIPCVGCLVGLIDWMPEDGEPKLCYDATAPRKIAGIEADLKCTRCKYHDKSCSKPREMDKEVRDLCQKLTHSPQDTESVRVLQAALRRKLAIEIDIEAHMFGSPEFRDPDEPDEDTMYGVESAIDTIRTLVDAMGSRRAGGEVREIRRATEMAAQLVHEIREQTPEQFADLAAKELGII